MEGIRDITYGQILSLIFVGLAVGAGLCGIAALIFSALMAKERDPFQRRSMNAGFMDALFRPGQLPEQARPWRVLALSCFAIFVVCSILGPILIHLLRAKH